MSVAKIEQLRSKIISKSPISIIKDSVELNDLIVQISPEDILSFFTFLKNDSELQFNLLVDITAIDWLDKRSERFELVYAFLSLKNLHRVRVKVAVSESAPKVKTITSLWNGANYLESEVYDMYGILFDGHPDLRRILMYEEFQGFPLRKDYPVQGKQPRIPLRSSEVRNTALDMKRPHLVAINKRQKNSEI